MAQDFLNILMIFLDILKWTVKILYSFCTVLLEGNIAPLDLFSIILWWSQCSAVTFPSGNSIPVHGLLLSLLSIFQRCWEKESAMFCSMQNDCSGWNDLSLIRGSFFGNRLFLNEPFWVLACSLQQQRQSFRVYVRAIKLRK